MRLAHPTAWFSRFINMPCHQSFAFFGSYLPSLLSGKKKRKKKKRAVLSMCLPLMGPFEGALMKTHAALAQVDPQPRFTA